MTTARVDACDYCHGNGSVPVHAGFNDGSIMYVPCPRCTPKNAERKDANAAPGETDTDPSRIVRVGEPAAQQDDGLSVTQIAGTVATPSPGHAELANALVRKCRQLIPGTNASFEYAGIEVAREIAAALSAAAAQEAEECAKVLEPFATAAEYVDDPSWSDTDELQVFIEDVLLFTMKVGDLRGAAAIRGRARR